MHDDGIDGDVIADDGVYSGTYTVPHGVNALDAIVTGSFTDAAGNRAAGLVSESLLNINMQPDSVTLAADVNESANTVLFSWSISNESDFESYRLFCDSTSSTVDTDDELVTIITAAATAQYETSTASGESHYRLFVFDRHGESAGSNVVSVTAP